MGTSHQILAFNSDLHCEWENQQANVVLPKIHSKATKTSEMQLEIQICTQQLKTLYTGIDDIDKLIRQHRKDINQAKKMLKTHEDVQNLLAAAYDRQFTDGSSRSPAAANPSQERIEHARANIRHLTSRKAELQVTIRATKEAISKAKADLQKIGIELAVVQTEQKQLEALIHSSKAFFNGLIHHPKKLATDLAANILGVVTDFEIDYPANQGIDTRKAIYDIATKLKLLYQTPMEANTQHRLTDSNPILSNEIAVLLQQSHIPMEADLPGLASTGKSCFAQYEAFAEQHANVFLSTTENFLTTEKAQFTTALQELHRTGEIFSRQDRALQRSVHSFGRHLLTSFENPTSTVAKDLKLFTTIAVKTTHLLAMQPGNVDANDAFFKSYRKLSHHVAGAPSVAKKVAGIMIGILGAVVMGVLIASAVCSFGILAPISALLGVKTALVTGAVVGGVLGVTGAGLFKHGMRKSVSKDLIKTLSHKQKSLKNEHLNHLKLNAAQERQQLAQTLLSDVQLAPIPTIRR
jgi:hypothetical protein